MNSQTNLSTLFPMIKTREQILKESHSKDNLREKFETWTEDQREDFLSICTGAKGVKMLYDCYFKEILNPEYAPERLSALLSVIIGRKVTVKYQLPNDNTRIGDELSLVITDIVVELEDGTLANIEVQKLGYAFTGERASCYSADLLLRQYKRVRDTLKQNFSYKNVAPVYTIVFLESSPRAFKDYKDTFVHKFSTVSDSGLKLNMLQNYVFVPVDIFLEKLHNKGMQSELDAWLTFLGCDEPDYIVKLIEKYPIFKPMYQDLYNMCLNTERMVNMFSEELKILDRNTVKYMIDELQEELDDTKTQLTDAKTQLTDAKTQLTDAKTQLTDAKTQLTTAQKQLADKDSTIAKLQEELQKYKSK